ncbi:tRNA guanosine(34) transglycosylase Tgt [Candidatus Roizmanbacteria bacterium]|nr:tRNA guanosine(34) transglycosylase Tgt [Candidatus Roizmanbacteria bacterium]
MFDFTVLAQDSRSRARAGSLTTPHGDLSTPELAFVATEGEVKAIPADKLAGLPANLLIVNTYHLYTKRFIEKIPPGGSIHDYVHFQKPIMSDSGGFQVFSLGFGKAHGIGKVAPIFPGYDLRSNDADNPLSITEEGVEFNFDGRKIKLTPEKSIELQKKIGADIIFAFDECTSPLNSYNYTKKAMELTHRWLERCLRLPNDKQALFAVVQGGHFADLRQASARFVGKQDVPGFGIGGSLGRSKEEIGRVLDWSIPLLPVEKPRHLLGIGQVEDIFASVERGVDLFDCVVPTREARHKVLYTKKGKVNLKKIKTSEEPLEADCRCPACKSKLTARQLYEYFLKKDPLAFYYATGHNIVFFADLMKRVRDSILDHKLPALKEEMLRYYGG